ncbi:hypothetical protein IV71_GL000496 [Fructobacillus fructosus KCTC 3544]|nr:hypothetical protein IV71_GL000496 [Fructobacillus fructosus KCTC 3544]
MLKLRSVRLRYVLLKSRRKNQLIYARNFKKKMNNWPML